MLLKKDFCIFCPFSMSSNGDFSIFSSFWLFCMLFNGNFWIFQLFNRDCGFWPKEAKGGWTDRRMYLWISPLSYRTSALCGRCPKSMSVSIAAHLRGYFLVFLLTKLILIFLCDFNRINECIDVSMHIRMSMSIIGCLVEWFWAF